MSTRRRLRSVLDVVLGTLAVALFGLIAAVVLVPLVMGWIPLTVLSGSMEPGIPTGSQVVLQRAETPAAIDKIKLGDVITFMPLPNNPTLVTHRVVEMTANSDGTKTFITRGDNNQVNDPAPIQSKQVRGVVQYHVPYIGYVATALNQHQKNIGIIIVAGLLFAYAGIHVVLALVRARRDRRADLASTSVAPRRASEEIPA